MIIIIIIILITIMLDLVETPAQTDFWMLSPNNV